VKRRGEEKRREEDRGRDKRRRAKIKAREKRHETDVHSLAGQRTRELLARAG
jgi:hypothetical protein